MFELASNPISYFGKMNSTLGSVVPLAMFVFVFLYLNSCICIFHCLQLADLLFITLCVPATAADYAFTSVWQFGEILTSLHIFHISYNHSYIIYFTFIISPFFYLIFTAESGLRRHMAYDNRTIHPSIHPKPIHKASLITQIGSPE